MDQKFIVTIRDIDRHHAQSADDIKDAVMFQTGTDQIGGAVDVEKITVTDTAGVLRPGQMRLTYLIEDVA